MRYINQNVTGFPVGPFVNPTDGITPVTGVVASSLNGVSIVNNVATTYTPTSFIHLANGFYGASSPPVFPLGPMEISFSNPSIFAPVWNEISVISQNVYNSFFGTQSLTPSASGSGSDPWVTALPGTYSAGEAGFILGTNLNATVSSRSTYAGGAVASVTAPVTLPTVPPSGYGSSPDPWLTSLPGSYTGSQAGYVLGSQAKIPIAGTVQAGATTTHFTLSITSGNSPVTLNAVNDRGCLFISGALIGAYPDILASVVQSTNVVALTVSGLPVAPSLNDVAWII